MYCIIVFCYSVKCQANSSQGLKLIGSLFKMLLPHCGRIIKAVQSIIEMYVSLQLCAVCGTAVLHNIFQLTINLDTKTGQNVLF